MGHPPQRKKQRQEQPVQAGTVRNPVRFEVPPTTFAVLKRGFHPHADGVLADPSTPCRSIRDEQPNLLVGWLPDRAEIGLQGLLRPELNAPAPLLTGLGKE